MSLLRYRRPSRELLDDPELPAEEMARSLQDLDLVNRVWGNGRVLARRLVSRLRSRKASHSTILDIGAGTAAVSRELAARLTRAGIRASVVAVDLQWRHLAAGRSCHGSARLPATAADAFSLPFPDGSADWIVSTLLFHHFSPAQNIRLLRELSRVAREGYALLDLRRSVFPLLLVSLAGRLAFKSRVSVEDGLASVRQAYTLQEARAVASAVPGARVDAVAPFRLLISASSGNVSTSGHRAPGSRPATRDGAG
jgi:SAM-dependent methyltransferase